MAVAASSQQSWDVCFSILPKVSRSFALAISVLKPALRESVCVAYLLCRLVDTFEDAANLSVERKAMLIRELERLVDDPNALPHDWHLAAAREIEPGSAAHDLELLRRCPDVIAAYGSVGVSDRQAIARCFHEMAVGMVEMQQVLEGHRRRIRVLPSMASLQRYCHYVAGTVGTLLTELFYAHSEAMTKAGYFALVDLSEAFAQTLQRINILKDVAGDVDHGWCFIPQANLDEAEVTPEALFDSAKRAEALRAIEPVLVATLRDIPRSWRYLALIPLVEREVRMFLGYSLVIGVKTVQLIVRSPGVLFDRANKTKITRLEVASIVEKVNRWVSDPAKFDRYYETLIQEAIASLSPEWDEPVRAALVSARSI